MTNDRISEIKCGLNLKHSKLFVLKYDSNYTTIISIDVGFVGDVAFDVLSADRDTKLKYNTK